MNSVNEFEKAAQEQQLSLPAQFFLFMRDSKKWWLLPIVIVLGLVGLLATFGGAAPFIYTMF